MALTHPLAPGVPVTLQTLWVFLAGLVLGPAWGAAAFALSGGRVVHETTDPDRLREYGVRPW